MPENLQIETFVWNGQKRYRCPMSWENGASCAFNCSSESQLLEHLKKYPHKRVTPNSAPEGISTPYVPPVIPEPEKRIECEEIQFAPSPEEEK